MPTSPAAAWGDPLDRRLAGRSVAMPATAQRPPSEAAAPGEAPAMRREWLLEIRLNDAEEGDVALFVEDTRTGRMLAPLETLRRWRFRIDPALATGADDQRLYPLDAIDGLRYELDENALVLEIHAPGHAFEPFRLQLDQRERARPQSGLGAFVDYDFSAVGGDRIENRIDGLLEGGLFGPAGVGLTSFRLDDIAGNPGLTRLDTAFVHDDADTLARLRIGDSISEAGSFARGIRFAGLQYGTNFAIDPTLVTVPSPAIGGTIERQSVVEVLVDNVTRATADLPPGPFTIDRLPVITGSGDIELRVTDLLGREQVFTQGYQISPSQLRAGLHDFSWSIGAARRNYGSTSAEYGDPIASATHRFGVTDRLTAEVHGEGDPDGGMVAAGATVNLGSAGTLTAGAGASLASGDGPGHLLQLGYELSRRNLSLGLRSRYRSRDFHTIGERVTELRREDSAQFSLSLGEAGRLGLLFARQSRRDGPDTTTVGTTYGIALGPGSLTANLTRSQSPNSEMAFSLFYSLPLGRTRSLTTRVDLRDEGEDRVEAVYRQSRGASDVGLDYRLAVEAGSDGERAARARIGYGAELADLTLEAERRYGDNALRLGAGGSLAMVDGAFAASRRIGASFGLVDLDGIEGVDVYVDNRLAGTTDERGRLLVTGLRPYERNRIHIDPGDLPLDATLRSGEAVAVPYERSGVTIRLDVQRMRRATAELLQGDGRPLPGGLALLDATGTVTALVGKAGLAEIGDLPENAGATIEGASGERLFSCRLPPVPPGDDPLPHLGEIACTG
ncbi:MAG: fimbria/pilus outer membrane usher protein [Geminicoccaceae bacterium]